MRVTNADLERLMFTSIMPGRFWTTKECGFLLQCGVDVIRRAIRSGDLLAEPRVRYAGNPVTGPFHRRLWYLVPDESFAAFRIKKLTRWADRGKPGPGGHGMRQRAAAGSRSTVT